MSNWQSSYRLPADPQGRPDATGGANSVNPESSPNLDEQYPDSFGTNLLSIALIGPDDERRRAASTVLGECQTGGIHEFSSYPPTLDDVPRLLEQKYDIIIIDLDSNPEYALELVESICANGTATVMVYSLKADSELLVRCMRAGAREFLTLPFAQNTMAESLVRASARRPAIRGQKKSGGRLLVFLGAKGGDGVTTLACNFAVALAKESDQSTLLIDLDLPLGDAALNLGITGEYSTINALQNANRLDSSFLSKLLVKHSSGVSVLGAPGKFPQYQAANDSIDRLIAVARQDFDNVVIDMGSRLDLMGTSLFKDGAIIYLVIQAGIAGLRNSNRLISQYFAGEFPKLEIVLNRYEARALGVAEEQITKALTRPAQWKIPNDYAAVRRMQHTAVPLALEDSPISRLIHQMARSACGLPPVQEKKSGFNLKSFGRGFSSKPVLTGEPQALTQLGLNSGSGGGGKPEVTEKLQSKSVPAARPVPPPAPSERTAPASVERADRPEPESQRKFSPRSNEGSSLQAEPETRTYKGATYVKGPGGEWHLMKAADSAAFTHPASSTQPVSSPSRPAVSSSQSISSPGHQAAGETRTYKGSTYVKGADGEWHLLKPEQPQKFEQPQRPEQPLKPEVVKVQQAPGHTLSWATPAPITFGAALGAGELNARASAAGRLVYTPAAGEILAAGTHNLSVTFTPSGDADAAPLHDAVALTVNKATPVINWPTPASIVHGVALSSAELNASAPVPGRFVYSQAEGSVPNAGVQTLTVTFFPADAANYNTAQAAVSITVAKARPLITWPTPASIVYGTELGSAQLNASALVPGSFSYSPAPGAVLAAGVQKLTVAFTPSDTANFTTVQSEVALAITKATPVLTWPAPAPIVYGTALGNSQLNAKASAPGKFTYIPAAGAVLSAGTHTPSVTFMPTDAANYTMAQAAVKLTVARATPSVNWRTPAPIAYGTPLSAIELNATASIPGRFTYTPEIGEMLPAGTHTLSVTFTPIDATDYAAVQATTQLTVVKAKQTILTWPTPAPISYGAPLSEAELNAAAEVPGTFAYAPAAGDILSTGTHKLTVTFTPADANFPAAQATVSLTVTKATPEINWPKPAAISYGAALNGGQLNATSSVPGTFVYSPVAGEVLGAGTHTLKAVFTPRDTANAASAQATNQLTVTKATPIITWSQPAAIPYGTPLSSNQLNAMALVPGVFIYTPAEGTVIASGSQSLSVTFIPTDSADYTTAQASVQLVVDGLPNIASLIPAAADVNAELSGLSEEKRAAQQAGTAINRDSKLETRTYKGATYVKGADGQWYLQKI